MRRGALACFSATTALAGSIAGGALVKKVWLEKYRVQKTELRSAERERDVTYTWLLLYQRGVSINEYFDAHGYAAVGVLGMQRLGRRAAEALGDRAVYAVEADTFAAVHERLRVWRLGDDPLPEADAILVTDLEGLPEKLVKLRREFSGNVVTLAEVLDWLLKKHVIEPRDGGIVGWPPKELLPSEGGSDANG